MTMLNITDGKNNISRDKPVEHIDLEHLRNALSFAVVTEWPVGV